MEIMHHEETDSYSVRLVNGQQLWCDCPKTLDDVLWRIDEHKQRKEETRAIVVSILVSAAALGLAAFLAGLLA